MTRARSLLAAGALAAAAGLAGAAGPAPGAPSPGGEAGAARGGPAARPGGGVDRPRAGADTVRTVGEGEVPRRAWSFPAGERFRYSARFGRVKVGHAVLAVEAVDTIGGTPAYRIAREVEAGVPFCKIDDRDVSWVAPLPLRTLRYEQHKKECPDYELDRRYEFEHGGSGSTWTMINMFPEGGGDDGSSGGWRLETVKEGVATAPNAIDDIAFLYLARMVPLEVGRTYRFERYFQEDGNPVVLEVLRREKVRVPAGTFRTVVIRPTIQTGGAFGKGGEAEVHVSDDGRRIPVKIEASMKIGSVDMYLTEYDLGRGGATVGSRGDAGAAGEPGEAAGAGGSGG